MRQLGQGRRNLNGVADRAPDLLGINTRVNGSLGAQTQIRKDDVTGPRIRVTGAVDFFHALPEIGKAHAQTMNAETGTVSASAICVLTEDNTSDKGTSSASQIAASNSEDASFWPRSTSDR